LPTSRGTSNGPDWADVAAMLDAFEKQNNCQIEICIHSATTMEQPDLRVMGRAWEKGADRREAKPLGSTSVIWRAEKLKTLEGLITYLLYKLDFCIAENEFDSVPKKQA